MLKATKLGRGRLLQSGLSLVELMVGIAIGLFVVAGASMLASTQLIENRRLLLETQVQQDLRATADIITRELRRTGYDSVPEWLVWSSSTPVVQPRPNNRSALTFGVGSDKVTYSYDRPGIMPATFGYQLVDGAIRHRIGATAQDLTDRNTLNVTDFTVMPQIVAAEQLACPKLCADGTQDCWPTVALTDATITIKAQAVSDPAVARTVVSRVRLRNDGVNFNLPAPATEVCP